MIHLNLSQYDSE